MRDTAQAPRWLAPERFSVWRDQDGKHGFLQVFISLKINTLMTFRALLMAQRYNPLLSVALIINSSINDLRVTGSHFLIIIS